MNPQLSPQDAPPPSMQMLQMVAINRWISHAIAVAARLDLATRLGSETLVIGDLARATGSSEAELYRLMRALASVGVFTEVEPRRFRNTPLSDTLRSDVPMSSRPLALFFGHDAHVKGWLGLEHSVKTGRSGFEHIHGMGVFEYVAEHPEVGDVFNNAMTGLSAAFGPAIAAACDFDGVERLVDVGGGHGQLLACILQRYPSMRGVLFDLPPVISGASAVIEPLGIARRVELVGGSFFDEVPSGEAYFMSHVLHDWSDADATRILQTIGRSASPGARLVLAEAIVQTGDEFDLTKFMDLEMLVATGGGRERDEAEWAELLRAGGFTLNRVVPAAPGQYVIEARRT